MASNTPNLQLYKKDPVADGADVFNIETMLNENWDKIDAAIGNIDIPDASTTEAGKVMLSNAIDGEREDVAATEKAVKLAYDKATELLSSYASGKDDNGKYTTIEWKRKDGTLFKKSVLSDPVGENYTVQTITWYDATGTSVEKTEIYDLTYDEDGFPISEVKR